MINNLTGKSLSNYQPWWTFHRTSTQEKKLFLHDSNTRNCNELPEISQWAPRELPESFHFMSKLFQFGITCQNTYLSSSSLSSPLSSAGFFVWLTACSAMCYCISAGVEKLFSCSVLTSSTRHAATSFAMLSNLMSFWFVFFFWAVFVIASAAAAERRELRCRHAPPRWRQRHRRQQQWCGHYQQSTIN